MLKKIGCLVFALAVMSVPAWSSDGANMSADDLLILARGGHGPGDGTGNGGTGPGDGTGNGSRSGDCPNLKTDANDDLPIIARRGNCGRGSGSNGGSGKGSRGNGGVCPWGLNL